MRQVFSSPRLENVEGIAQMLRDAGIEVRVTHGRSFKGAIRGNFSYSESLRSGPQPAVWVVKSEDQPRARELLRGAGLFASTRTPADSYLGPSLHERAGPAVEPSPQRRAFRYKVALLLAIAVAVALAFSVMRKPVRVPAPAPQAAATPAADTASTRAPAVLQPVTPTAAYRVDTPPALAELLLATELQAHDAGTACLGVDGGAPPGDVLARLRRDDLELAAITACPDGSTLAIDVADYRTDGSGIGTIQVRVRSPGADGTVSTQTRSLQVRRDGFDWRVVRVLDVR